jgi:hypothetical protein
MESQHSEQVLPPCPGFLHDTTRKVLPGAFVIVFVITGTYVLIYSLSLHEPVPSNFMTGAAITFGVLFALMIVGNFFLYARKRMNLIRSTLGSERSSRIEGERDAWYHRLRKHLDEYEDGPCRLLREFALKRALKTNSRKGSVNVVNQNRELSMIDLSQSDVSRRDLGLTPDRTDPVDRTGREIDLESGRHASQQPASGDLSTTTPDVEEATRTRSTPEVSRGVRNPTGISYIPRYQERGLAGNSKITGISMAARNDPPSGTNRIACQGRLPPVETKKTSAMRTRTRQLVPPEKQLIEQHSLRSVKRERYKASPVLESDLVDSRLSSEPPDGATPHHSTYQIHRGERSSSIQLYRLELPQQ